MGKVEADGLRKIDVRFLKKHGYLSGTRWGVMQWTSNFSGYDGSATLESTTVNDVKHLRIRCSESKYGMQEGYECEVELTTTPCNYGGKRYWMVCPSWGCHQRVGTLYFGGGCFACRHCFNLTYKSQNQSKRYNGFISIPMLDAVAEKVKRTYYGGKPTRKYRQYLKMVARFTRDVALIGAVLGNKSSK
jgi:hypothetical protein